MAIIEIDGIGRIEVGDEFKAMSPTDQDAFVQSVIADVGKGKKSSVGTGAPSLGADIAKSAGVGLAQGAISTAGTIGDLRDAGSWIAGKAASLFGASPETAKNVEATVGLLGRLNPISLFAPTSKEIKQAVTPFTGEFYEPQTTAGKYVKSAAEFIPGAAVAPGGLARNIGLGITSGLGAEAGSQLTEGTAAEPYARVAGAVAGGLAPGMLSRVITPMRIAPERQSLVQTLEAEGVPLTAGQKTGSKPLQYAESMLGDVPGAGGKAAEKMVEQQRAFTGAAMRRGGMEAATDAGPATMSKAFEQVGQKFDDLASRTNARLDTKFAQELTEPVQQYVSLTARGERKPIIENIVNSIVDVGQANGGVIAGEQYKAWRSQLTNAMRGTNDPEFKQAAGGIVRALDKVMERSSGAADAAAWREVRGQYKNLLALERAATAAGEAGAQGFISPSALRGAVVNQGRRAYAQGQGDLADLARAGEGVMKPLPNSGTAQRNYVQGALTGGGFMAGGLAGGLAGILGPAIAGRALMSAPMQAYLSNQLIPNLQRGLLAVPDQRALNALMLARPALPAQQ